MFNKSLNYNYNGKKQKKPPRVAYVPKHNIEVGYSQLLKESFPSQNLQLKQQSIISHNPIIYKSSIPMSSNNLYIINNNNNNNNNDNNDESIDKKLLIFENKLGSTSSSTSLLKVLNINPDSNSNSTLIKPDLKKPDEELMTQIMRTIKTQKSKQDLYIKLYGIFKEKNITKIVNVYQEKYKDGKLATGFGDFLRGNYYLMQFCSSIGIQFDINMTNHPISTYFKNTKTDIFMKVDKNHIFAEIDPLRGNNFIPNIDEKNIILYRPNELFSIEFMLHIITRPIYDNGTIYIYMIAYPQFEVIAESHKSYMRFMLEPSRDIQLYVNYMMNLLKLYEKQYITIHIRSGDRFLIHGLPMNNQYLLRIKEEIGQLIHKQNKGQQYLLLSDNNVLKEILVKEYTQLKTLVTEITHSGEGVAITDKSIKNTLLDFYLLAKSSAIFSFSCYSHGTGFSKWTAETYNVPYICKFVEY